MFQEAAGEPSADRYSGIKLLWAKVIIRAAYDWVTYRDSTKLEARKIAEAAQAWIFGPSELFNGFENICHYLGEDPKYLRRRILSMSKKDVAKIEWLERSGSLLKEEKKTRR